MNGYVGNIESQTLGNSNFRQVVFTGKHAQLVLMSLEPNEEIGIETHTDTDQFFRIESGVGKVIIDGEEHQVKADDAIFVPAGAEHNVINTSATEELKLYTLYAPPHHRDDTVHVTKEVALADQEDHV